MISKIIHQTWISEDIPKHFKVLSDTWKSAHPDWEYKLWTDKMNREFIEEFYPNFLGKYDSYPLTIQRVDAVRYFILKKFGGVYVDMDFQCFKDISSLLENENFVIGKEPIEHAKRFSKDLILCNAFMASSIENDFLQSVCDLMSEYPVSNKTSPIEVLESTGPFLITRAFEKFVNKQAICVLDSSYFYPLTMAEVRTAYKGELSEYLQDKLDKSFGLHYFWGGW